ncbi:MAG: Rrf2 family transcriptional regulator [bacterium]
MAANLLKISEAASLAIHAMALLTSGPGKSISVKEMASELTVSENHLSKVLQRLAKAGYVDSARGPKGGFTAGRKGTEITLLELYEEIEGALSDEGCLLDMKACREDACIMGSFVGKINAQVRDFLANTKLSDMKNLRGERRLRVVRRLRGGRHEKEKTDN